MIVVLDPASRPVIAHRGGRARGPENTIEAMEAGIADGADAIELDVHISADGEVVVIHDAAVDRTTDGTGLVAQMTFAELRALNAGFRFEGVGPRARSRHARIPALREVLERFPRVPLIIEVKTPAASAATRALIERDGAEDRCLVDSFHGEALKAFAGSRIALGPSRDGLVRLIARTLLPIGARATVRPSALCIPRRYRGFPLPVTRLAALMRAAGKPVHVWTVNQPAAALELWRMGVSGIVTDDVRAMVAARADFQKTRG
jgi:glycerophosphoryl diester phosphodiesterase